MLQMGTHILVIVVRVIKTKMIRNLDCHHPEKVTHDEQRILGMSVAGIRICFLEHIPQLQFKILPEVLTEFSRVA